MRGQTSAVRVSASTGSSWALTSNPSLADTRSIALKIAIQDFSIGFASQSKNHLEELGPDRTELISVDTHLLFFLLTCFSHCFGSRRMRSPEGLQDASSVAVGIPIRCRTNSRAPWLTIVSSTRSERVEKSVLQTSIMLFADLSNEELLVGSIAAGNA